MPLWLIIAGLGLTQIIGWGSTYYALGALSQDIARSEGWSSTLIFGAFSAALLLSGLISPWAGRFIDLKGGRSLMTAGIAAGRHGMPHHRRLPAPRDLLHRLAGAGRGHAPRPLRRRLRQPHPDHRQRGTAGHLLPVALRRPGLHRLLAAEPLRSRSGSAGPTPSSSMRPCISSSACPFTGSFSATLPARLRSPTLRPTPAKRRWRAQRAARP